jgi:RNA polymerase sigma-70 factor (ECF subfamily)
MNSLADYEILELYFTRDETAIEVTVDKYGNYCRKIAMNILGNSEQDCDECLNDVWLSVWNSIPPQRPKVFGGFLAKITRNIAFDRYRANRAKKRGGEFTSVLSELDECLPSSSNVETEFEAGHTAELINRFLGRLPKLSREVFVRRYFIGESVAEIAEFCGISYSKATSMLFRLRKKLKLELEKEGVNL